MLTQPSDSDRIRETVRVSDIPCGIKIPPGIVAKPKPPFEETDEYREMMRQMHDSKLRKAGLFGKYASADSDEGHMVCAIAEQGRGAYLWGEPGRGKTYAAATAVRLFEESGRKAKLISAKNFLGSVRAGFDGKDKDALGRAERYDLLALDDLGAEKVTEWTIETITGLIDKRTACGLPTIITSNYRIGQIRDIWGGMDGKRIASRLAGSCEIIEFEGEDRRLGNG